MVAACAVARQKLEAVSNGVGIASLERQPVVDPALGPLWLARSLGVTFNADLLA